MPDSNLVDAHQVATFLGGISVTTVYSLVKGVRGWNRITPLPVEKSGEGPHRQRYMFDLKKVEAWKARTSFVAKTAGRRRKRVQLKRHPA